MSKASISSCILVLVIFVNALCAENSATEEEARESLHKFTIANNELAFNLYRKLASNSSENIFFSPFSISVAFAMLFHGTRNNTAQELRRALGYEKADIPSDLVHLAIHRFLTQVLKGEDASNAYILKSANAILVDKQLDLLPGYKNQVQDLYEASVREVDFREDGDEVAEEINQWVREKTNGMIDELVDKLHPRTVMFLLNAIYFKGVWKVPFDPMLTRQEVFYNNGLASDAKTIPLMKMTSLLKYAWMSNYQALELWYKGENISMLILLPHEHDGLADLEKGLSPGKLTEILDELEIIEVDLSLPKFKLEFSEELSDEMMSLGAEKIFTTNGSANFSGISRSRCLYVSQVVHKAIVEVNEEGSQAAAVTEIRLRLASAHMAMPIFRVDHPFLFFIMERGSNRNLILFMGRVNAL